MFHAHTVLCSLCTLIPGSLAHATVVKYGGVNKSNGLDLLSASRQLNRIPQGNEVQVAIMGNMEMSVFYKVSEDWESIVVWDLQERFVSSPDIHSATIGSKRRMLTVEFGPHYKYAKHPSPIFQSSTLAAAGKFHKMFESSEFSRSLGGKSGFPREKKTHELVNETGETQADAIVVNCRQRRLHLQPHVLCRRHEWEFPRSYTPCQAANFCRAGRRSQIPVSDRESASERRWLFSGWSCGRGRSIEFLNLFANLRYLRI